MLICETYCKDVNKTLNYEWYINRFRCIFCKNKSLGCGDYAIIPVGNFNVKTGTMNITQAMTLLLLSKCLVHTPPGLCYILFIPAPKNQIGFN